MATGWYSKALKKFADQSLPAGGWTSANLKAILIDAGTYTADLVNHEFLTSVPGGARVAIAAVVTPTVADDGICDAADTTWPNVTGVTVEAVLFYIDTGVEATSPLLLYVDNSPDFPIPATSGQDVIVRWSNGANKVARI